LPGTHDLWLFVITGLVLNATPGVDMLYTISRTAQHGWRGGVVAAAGICTGCWVHVVGAAVGVAALIAASAAAFTLLKLIGAAYLLWLGVQMLIAAWRKPLDARPPAATPQAPAVRASWRKVFWQGFLGNALNPKVALFFLAFVPQFVSADAPHQPLAFLALGALFIVNSFAFLCVLVAAVARLRGIAGSPRISRGLQAAAGASFVLLAARLAAARHTV
jgi:threonine/homoserine/homoserine lactone efflux protein